MPGVRVALLAVALLAVALLCAGAAGAPFGLLHADAAYAGQWVQVSCANPFGTPAPTEGWSSLITGTPEDGSTNTNCASSEPISADMSPSGSNEAAVGSAETLQYTPPPGSTLAGGYLDVNVQTGGYAAGSRGAVTFYSGADTAGDAFLSCDPINDSCNNAAASGYTGVLTLPTGRGGNLYLSASCDGTPGQSCNIGANGAWSSLELIWAHLLLTNTSSPAATAFSGSLLAPNAHATADIAFTATDPAGPGIYQVTLNIDGNPLYNATPDTNNGECAPVGTDSTDNALMFGYQQPCPQTETVDIPIATTALADGEHNLKIIVTDAAQNTSTVLDQTITTLNHPTAISSSAAPNTPAPGTPPATSVAPPVYRLSPDRATRALTHGITRTYGQSALRRAGHLGDHIGVVTAGVPITLWTKPAHGGTYKQIAQTTTGRSGAWTVNAPPSSSRLLRVVAGQAQRPAAGQNAIAISEAVRPTLSLHIATPGSANLIFTGHIAIAPLGNPRPLVIIETPGPHGWEAVGTPIRVNAHGAYRYTYRSSAVTLHRTFKFRAITPETARWQHTTSPSRTAVVH
jgi:hypothetical protein